MNSLIAAALVSLVGFLVVAHIYGVVLSFKRHPLYGVISLLVPGFASIVGLVKILGKTNLLDYTKKGKAA
jgi:hypothetical protein